MDGSQVGVAILSDERDPAYGAFGFRHGGAAPTDRADRTNHSAKLNLESHPEDVGCRILPTTGIGDLRL